MSHACRCGFELCVAIGSFHVDKDGLRVCWRKELLEAVSTDPFLLKIHLSKVAQDSITLSQAARGLSKFFETIGQGRENDSFAADLALAAMKFDASVYHALPTRLSCRRDIATAAVKGAVSIYGGLQAPLSTDHDVICAVLQEHPEMLDFVGSVTSNMTEEDRTLLVVKLRAALPVKKRNDVLSWLPTASLFQAAPLDADVMLVEGSELICPVCFEDLATVAGAVRQCKHGHLLCGECLQSLRRLGEEKVLCPVCKTPESRTQYPICLFAEKALQSLRRLCPFECGTLLSGKVVILQHMDFDCKNRTVTCPCCSQVVRCECFSFHAWERHALARWEDDCVWLLARHPQQEDCEWTSFRSPLKLLRKDVYFVLLRVRLISDNESSSTLRLDYVCFSLLDIPLNVAASLHVDKCKLDFPLTIQGRRWHRSSYSLRLNVQSKDRCLELQISECKGLKRACPDN